MKGTWEVYSKQVAGRILPMTPSNEEYVALKMIEFWLEKGYTTAQVVLNWNHPLGVKNGCSSGVNSKGVKWNSCDYQRKVLSLM